MGNTITSEDNDFLSSHVQPKVDSKRPKGTLTLPLEEMFFVTLEQWFSTFRILRAFNTGPHVG